MSCHHSVASNEKSSRRQRFTRERSVSGDVLWGLRWGGYYALFFSVPAAIAWAVKPRLVEARGFGLASLLGYHLMLGASVGATMGLLRPLGRCRLGAALMGSVACAMLLAEAGLVGGVPLGFPLVAVAVGYGVPFGIFAGLYTWRRLGAGATYRPPAT